jgi:hypothetical protein
MTTRGMSELIYQRDDMPGQNKEARKEKLIGEQNVQQQGFLRGHPP